MLNPRYIPLVLKQIVRHRTRSLLTIAGVAIAMFLFIAIQTLQRSVHDATSVAAGDTTLIVYRANRFCPATSRLPEHYGQQIARLEGVVSAMPFMITVNNCGASLDVITYRGIPQEQLKFLARNWEVIDGSLDIWHERSDAAALGERLARRRGFKVGDSFEAAGVTVSVAAIIRSTESQDQNVAYVQLPFLQQVTPSGSLGVVTGFAVRVDDPDLLKAIASRIDETFRHDVEPTHTSPEKAFIAQAGADVVNLVGFTHYLGWGCLIAVLALIANAIVLSVQDRIREHAVLQTLGFRSGLIARLILAEGLIVGVIGGLLGTIGAAALVHYGQFTLSNEGLHILVSLDPVTLGLGLAIAAGVGVLAGLVPALQAGRREIATCFRAV
ncbi:MAG TPA: ABC transporter permease [Phycisphaerales bacterium]|nr:ABC transporter permease [Phycisphaerales bacterium]HRQ76713.1 ABC transporter permease [Phycisphaerales bacterium]